MVPLQPVLARRCRRRTHASGLGHAGGLRPHSYATLFGLIACTGLRTSEALSLTCGDAGLHRGVLTVRAGKGGRTRPVPLHPTALGPLRAYVSDRIGRFGWPDADEAFFRTDYSERIGYNAADGTFTGLRRQLGWTAAGRARAPRVHDLRHYADGWVMCPAVVFPLLGAAGLVWWSA